MSDKETPATTPTITKLDLTKPFYLTLRQTETRNIIELFQEKTNEDSEAKAKERAGELAERTGVHVAVLGPQRAVFAPPAPPKSEELSLDF